MWELVLVLVVELVDLDGDEDDFVDDDLLGE